MTFRDAQLGRPGALRLRFLAWNVTAVTNASETDKPLGGQITAMRRAAGLRDGRKEYTQLEVAERIHVSEGTVSNWERGRGVTHEKVAIIAAALGMDSRDDVLGDLPEDEPTVEAALAHVRAAYDMLRRVIEARSNP